MRIRNWGLIILAAMVLLASSAFTQATQQRGGQETFGPYEPVPDWPRPLPDGPDGVKHDGWTWGSGAGVFCRDSRQGLGLPAFGDRATARCRTMDLCLLARAAPNEYRQTCLFR